MAEIAKQLRKVPKGGRKGGTRFPNINLQKALEYSKKLVSKTHNGPQPEQTIFVGVFNTSGTRAAVRASALKQYQLMEGDAAKGYSASRLAREIEAAVPEERPLLFQQAFLSSKLFKQVYDTLQSETVSRARVRQVVITAEVHPDLADACVTCFIDGAVYAGLGTLDGENVVLVGAAALAKTDPYLSQPEQNGGDAEEHEQTADAQLGSVETEVSSTLTDHGRMPTHNQPVTGANADVRVNLTVDSSSDPDKLEKQLRLLKQYGLLRS